MSKLTLWCFDVGFEHFTFVVANVYVWTAVYHETYREAKQVVWNADVFELPLESIYPDRVESFFKVQWNEAAESLSGSQVFAFKHQSTEKS